MHLLNYICITVSSESGVETSQEQFPSLMIKELVSSSSDEQPSNSKIEKNWILHSSGKKFTYTCTVFL